MKRTHGLGIISCGVACGLIANEHGSVDGPEAHAKGRNVAAKKNPWRRSFAQVAPNTGPLRSTMHPAPFTTALPKLKTAAPEGTAVLTLSECRRR